MAKKMRRRSFLKYGAAGAASVALTHLLGRSLLADKTEDRPFVDRCTGKKVEGKVTTCAGCGAACGMMAFVRSGQLMKLAGNPAHPANKGSLCLVGQAGLYTLYDPERVTAPLVRTGKRGQGRWKEISWDEAYAKLAAKMKAKGGKGLVLETRGGSTARASREFVSRLGGRLVRSSYMVSPNREAALGGTFGAPGDFPDMANTSYILNFGANPFESDPFGTVAVSALTAARSKGGSVKMVTFDPRLSATAGRSDEWYPLAPGTESVVALAMANVIMEDGLYDRRFMEEYTNTRPDEVAAHVREYTPAMAERLSGVKASDIRRIAAEYARADRAVVLTGDGVSQHPAGTDNERAVRLLSIITGKVDRPGCNFIPKTASPGEGGPEVKAMAPDVFHKGLKDGSERVGVYMVHACDPLYSSPESGQVARALADEGAVPFIVCLDTHVTDTGLYADMILPMTTYLEEYGVESSPGQGGSRVLGYRQPVVPATGDCRPYVDVLAELSGRMGARLPFEDSEDYAEKLASGYEGLAKSAGFEEFAARGFFVMPKQTGRGPYKTPSGRIEAAWEKALPGHGRPGAQEDARPGEFVLVKYSPSAYREGVTENNLLLREIFHDNKAFINKEAGEQMGLKTWDTAILASELGKLEVTVILSPGVHPGAVAIASGCGHTGYGRIEKAERFESKDPFTKVIWWDKDGNGVNTNAITPFNLDQKSGGQGWMLTKVTIEKA